MAKVVIEAAESPPRKNLPQVHQSRLAPGFFAALALSGGASFSDGYGSHIGKAQLARGEHLLNRELWKRMRIRQPRQFFFFDRSYDSVVVKERSRSVWSGSGDAEDVHDSGIVRNRGGIREMSRALVLPRRA